MIRTDIYTIDWDQSPRVIWVDISVTEANVQDVYDTCRYYEAQSENMDDPFIIDAGGLEPLGGGQKVGLTVSLINAVYAFAARPGPDWVICNMTGGNIVSFTDETKSETIYPRLPTAYVSADRTSSASATLQELADIQYSSFSGGVTVDVTSPYSGTEYPIGTQRQPVNNMTDALNIAISRGFSTFYIIGNITVDSGGDYSSMIFIGESLTKSVITVDEDANVYKSEFSECTLTGTLDGQAVAKHCRISNINYINGVIEQCLLEDGTIVLSGSEEAVFLDCWAGATGTTPPIIDMGGSGQDLIVRNYAGEIQIINKMGEEKISITLVAGKVTLDSTITNGSIRVSGIGTVINNTSLTIDDVDLLNTSLVQQSSFNNCVHIDTLNGFSGTAFPNGTLHSPVNNLADAKSIATERGFDKFCLLSDLTILSGEVIDGLTITSHNWSVLTLESGSSCVNTTFDKLSLYGAMSDYWNVLIDCWIYNITNFCGWVRGGSFEYIALGVGDPGEEFGSMSYFDSVVPMYPGVANVLVMNSDVTVSFTDAHDLFEIRSMVADTTLNFGLAEGTLTLDSSCTGGNVTVIGVGTLIDNSTGTNVLVNNLLNTTVQQQVAFNNRVCIDQSSDNTGTDFPVGTRQKPVNNLTDAVSIATSRGFNILNFVTDFTFADTDYIENFILMGEGLTRTTLTFTAGCITALCRLENCRITGTGFGSNSIINCHVDNYIDLDLVPSDSNSTIQDCILSGTIMMSSLYTGTLTVINCSSTEVEPNNVIFDMNGGAFSVVSERMSGNIEIRNCTNSNCNISVGFTTGKYVIHSSVTAGNFTVRGIVEFENNGTPTTICTDGLVSVEALLDVEQGDWKIENNQMIFYTRTGSELMRFNLLNAAGEPSMTEVFERQRV